MYTNCGTLGYVAPEVTAPGNQGYDGKKADIWSIGILICEVIGGSIPYEEYNDPQKLLKAVQMGNLTLPRNMSIVAKDLAKQILNKDPN
jgi:serine/threonine protein kinase